MKKLLALLCAIFALSQTSKATPILDVTFTQNNWHFELTMGLTGIEPGDTGLRLFIDDLKVFGSPSDPANNTTFGFGPGLIPDTPHDFFDPVVYAPGEHFAFVLFYRPSIGADIRVDGDETWFLAAPTGPRPQTSDHVQVPDQTGLSIFAMGLVGLAFVRRKINGAP